MQCIGFGDADKSGHRIFTFRAMVDGEMRVYQVEAGNINEAQTALERSLDTDEMQNLGAVGGAGLAVMAVIVGGVVWIAHKMALFKPATKGPGSISNGSEISAPGEEKTTPQKTGVRTNLFRAPQWKGINYGSEAGLMAGDNPLNSIRVVVYADGDPQWLLPLVRQASYDAESGTLRDGIVVMQFPTKAAARLRHTNALEVFVGENLTQSRTFDVAEKDPQAALIKLRSLLTPYL